MQFMYFSINYRYSDILLKKQQHKLHLYPFILLQSHLLLCFYGFCDVSVTLCNVSVTLYQNWCSMYIRGLIPRNFTEVAEAVPIAK